jgi:hypothetical protein
VLSTLWRRPTAASAGHQAVIDQAGAKVGALDRGQLDAAGSRAVTRPTCTAWRCGSRSAPEHNRRSEVVQAQGDPKDEEISEHVVAEYRSLSRRVVVGVGVAGRARTCTPGSHEPFALEAAAGQRR